MNDFSISPKSKIGVFAPSSFVERADIDAAKALMEARGYEVFIHPQSFTRNHQSAGTTAEKLEALHDLYRDSSIDVVWAAGGGNRALDMLDGIDYTLVKANPKPMIGFSDVTALMNATTVKTGGMNIHGPVFRNLPKHQSLDDVLSGTFSMPFDEVTILQHGKAQGTLLGGNLSIFQYLPETLGQDFLKGSILFLEDCNEEISRIDRMFIHLKRLGVFEQISALILGQFTDLQDSARPFGLSLEDIVREHTQGCDIPVLMDAPFGHGDVLYPLPIGGHASLDTRNAKITFTNPP